MKEYGLHGYEQGSLTGPKVEEKGGGGASRYLNSRYIKPEVPVTLFFFFLASRCRVKMCLLESNLSLEPWSQAERGIFLQLHDSGA